MIDIHNSFHTHITKSKYVPWELLSNIIRRFIEDWKLLFSYCRINMSNRKRPRLTERQQSELIDDFIEGFSVDD